MKKCLLFTGIVFIFLSSASAQSYIESFSICDKTFSVKCEAQIDNSIQVSVVDGITDSLVVKYKIWTNDMEVFAKNFTTNFLKSGKIDTCKDTDPSSLLPFARKLLKNYITALQNTSPPAGVFTLKDSVDVHLYYFANNKMKDAKSTEKFKVVRLQAEINNGYMENIVAYILDSNIIMRFIAPFPIGMSSINNFKKYDSTNLYYITSSPFILKGIENIKFFIRLGELINYDYFLGVDRRDYSPKDTALDIQGGTSLTLHKQETKKLFEVHIFSDFKGLKEDNPNGLIQLELKKRININTKQYLSIRPLYWFAGSIGFFQYIAPAVTISKIEQHNKLLNLFDLDSVRLNPGATDTSLFSKNYHRYQNALSLYQYQWLSAGTDINLFYINNHNLKFNIYFNAGIRLGITDVIDSLTSISSSGIVKTGFGDNYSVNTIQAYPEIRINFLPEERFNFSLSHKWVYFKPLSPTVQMVSYDNDNVQKIYPRSDSWLNIAELLMTIQVNHNSKLFGRLRFNWEAHNNRNNFSQIQVGYSTYLLGNK